MFNWIADNAATISVLLGFAGLGLGVGWWMTRERRYAIGAGGVICLIGVVWLVSHVTVTDTRRLRSTVQEMADAVGARRPDIIMGDVSDRFELNGLGKEAFRGVVERYVGGGQVDSMWVSDIQIRELSRPERRATVLFNVGASGPAIRGEGFYRCEAHFALEENEHWRLVGFRLSIPPLDPASGHTVDLPFGR